MNEILDNVLCSDHYIISWGIVRGGKLYLGVGNPGVPLPLYESLPL